MTSDELVDIDESWNRFGTCQVANGYEVNRIARAIDFTKVFLCNDMYGIVDCRMLRDATLKFTLPASLPN
jgi:hypothetical protein